MSVLFPKVNKPPKWEWRPIYYDPQKDEMERKLRELQAKRAAEEAKDGESAERKSADVNYVPTMHRGSFRESRENSMSIRQKANRQSKLILWIVLLVILIVSVYVLL